MSVTAQNTNESRKHGSGYWSGQEWGAQFETDTCGFRLRLLFSTLIEFAMEKQIPLEKCRDGATVMSKRFLQNCLNFSQWVP